MIAMKTTIIFDLDGTLLDTLDDLTDSVNHVLAANNMPLRTRDEIRSFVGNGIPTLIRRSVPTGTPEEISKKLTIEMESYYKNHARIKTDAYEGIAELLHELAKKNIKSAVVTNKEQTAARILCKEIFGDVFTTVIGDNGVDKLKPAPDNVFRAMKELNSSAADTLYVGDSNVDMETAINAGLESVGVLWGFRDRKTLEESGANHIIAAPKELLNIISG